MTSIPAPWHRRASCERRFKS